MRMSQVFIDDMRLYAYHGVMAQEQTVGAWFSLSLRVDCDISRAAAEDEVKLTVSYADLADIVSREMAVSSKLLEHVAARIAKAIFRECEGAKAVHLRLTKLNPPMGYQVAGAGVDCCFEREEMQGEQ